MLAFTARTATGRPRVRQIAAGDLVALAREILAAKARCGMPLTAPVRSCYEAGRDAFWLHRWLVAHGHRQRGGGFVEHRGESAGAAGEDGSVGCRQAVAAVAAVGAGRAAGVECGARADAGGGSGAAADAGNRDGAERPDAGAQSDPGIAGDARDSVRADAALSRAAGGAADRGWAAVAAAWRERLAREWAHLQTIEARLAALGRRATEAIAAGADRVAQVAQQLAHCAASARRVRRSSVRNCSARGPLPMGGSSAR